CIILGSCSMATAGTSPRARRGSSTTAGAVRTRVWWWKASDPQVARSSPLRGEREDQRSCMNRHVRCAVLVFAGVLIALAPGVSETAWAQGTGDLERAKAALPARAARSLERVVTTAR